MVRKETEKRDRTIIQNFLSNFEVFNSLHIASYYSETHALPKDFDRVMTF